MIKVARLSSPQTLEKQWRKWTKDYLAASGVARTKLEARYRKADIRKQLNAMFNGKCAYCESTIGVVDYAHIEHFRPKHTYPERTYLWRNMLLSCTKCNGAEHKGKKFPLSTEGGPLVNPCIEDPSDHFYFCYNSLTKEARVIPLSTRGKVTEKTLGLNRIELLRMRSRALRSLIYIRMQADTDPVAFSIISDTLAENGAYMAFVKKYLPPLTGGLP